MRLKQSLGTRFRALKILLLLLLLLLLLFVTSTNISVSTHAHLHVVLSKKQQEQSNDKLPQKKEHRPHTDLHRLDIHYNTCTVKCRNKEAMN